MSDCTCSRGYPSPLAAKAHTEECRRANVLAGHWLVIPIAPVTKKNSQQIWRGRNGRPFVVGSNQSRAWQESAVAHLKRQWTEAPLTHDVNVRARFYRERAAGDLINYCQALADALEKAGVLKNDRQIAAWDGSRLDKDAAHPRTELVISIPEASPPLEPK